MDRIFSANRFVFSSSSYFSSLFWFRAVDYDDTPSAFQCKLNIPIQCGIDS